MRFRMPETILQDEINETEPPTIWLYQRLTSYAYSEASLLDYQISEAYWNAVKYYDMLIAVSTVSEDYIEFSSMLRNRAKRIEILERAVSLGSEKAKKLVIDPDYDKRKVIGTAENRQYQWRMEEQQRRNEEIDRRREAREAEEERQRKIREDNPVIEVLERQQRIRDQQHQEQMQSDEATRRAVRESRYY